jgi:hypothetical protein
MALGAVSSGVTLLYLASWTVFRTRPGQDPGLNWGAAIGVLAFALCGGTTGAIAGLVGALRAIVRGQGQPWKPMTWTGTALGLAAGLAISFSSMTDRQYLPGSLVDLWAGTAVFTAAAGILGGLIGDAASNLHGGRPGAEFPTPRNRHPS